MSTSINIPRELVLGLALLIIATAGMLVMLGEGDATGHATAETCDGLDNDLDGQVDEGFSVTCDNNDDCGPTGNFGEPYCKEGNVWQGLMRNECRGKPGTCMSECSGTQTEEMIMKCKNGCSAGNCI